MLDLALATHLLEAVPANARIILLGDKDQLSAVDSGSEYPQLSPDPTLTAACVHDLAALANTPATHIVPPAPMQASALRDSAVWFSQSFRFAADSAIGRIATLINIADAPGLLHTLREAAQPELAWIGHSTDPAVRTETQILQCMERSYAPMLDAVRLQRGPASVSQAFAAFRVLCALRESPRGVIALNAEFSRRWMAALGGEAGAVPAEWFPGRPVQILRNDYALQLFNGDIGIALPDADGQTLVHFPQSDGSYRAIAPVRLPQHETAFAMTVHKSQGSEFDAVLVVLPDQRNRLTTRELLYTGVTRARQHVTLCASAAVLSAAVSSATQRHSGLLDRLRG